VKWNRPIGCECPDDAKRGERCTALWQEARRKDREAADARKAAIPEHMKDYH